jgi:hypothetical protein
MILTNMLGIFTAALHLGLIVGFGELLLVASQVRTGSIGGVVELAASVRAEGTMRDRSPWAGNEGLPA